MDPKELQQIEQYLKASGLKAQELSDRMNVIKNSTAEFNRELLNTQRYLSEVSNEFTDLSKQFKNVLNDLKGWDDTSGRINRSFKTLGNLADKLKYDALDISKLSKKDLENLQKKAKIEVENLKAQKEALDITYKTADLNNIRRIAEERGLTNTLKEIAQYQELQGIFDENNKLIEEEDNYVYRLNRLTKERLADEIKITKNLGAMGAIYNGIATTLQNFGIDSETIKNMGDELEEAAKKGKVGFKELYPIIKKGLTEALQDPLVQFTIGLKLLKSGFNDIKKAFDIYKEYNALFVNTARNIGMSVNQTKKMGEEAAFTKNTIEGTNGAILNNIYSQKQLQQAISDVNTQLGLSVDLGGSTIDEFTAMTNQMGLSAEEATKIYRLGLLSNTNLKDTNKSITAGIVAAQKSTGIQVNAKQVFQEIGKLSAGITAKFQQNPRALAEAVIQAKKLGTNLETIDKIGDSLLNWESSIENELKAELITGKQLNLERARAAALTGDQATLTAEIASQVGNINDFQKMNVIAQKSLAEAFGLSRDEMADMLQKQEVFTKLGDVSGKSAAEQLRIAKERGLSESDSLVVNLKQQAAAEKMEAAFDSIKTLIADLVSGPFSGFVNLMTYLSKHAWMVYTAVGALAAISLGKTIAGLTLMAIQMGLISAEAITANAMITFGVGLLIAAAAVAGGMALLSSSKEEATADIPKYAKGGIVTKPHIGMVGEAGPEAMIPLNSSRAAGILGGGGDSSLLVAAMNEVRNAVNSLANKPQPTMALHVGREKLGEVIGSVAETGTAQYKNAYNLA